MDTPDSAPSRLPLRSTVPDRFVLGDWTVEPSAGCFSQGPETVHVEPKVMEVLLALAADQGEVVSRHQLFDLVWPDVIVTDSAINRSISDLRRVLGDDSRHPTYIETIPKVGYRLLQPLRPAPSASGDGTGDPSTPPLAPLAGDGVAHAEPVRVEVALASSAPSARATAPRALWAWAAAVAVLVAGVSAGVWASRPLSFAEAVAAADARIVTTVPGAERDGQISPDGASVVFLSHWPDREGRQMRLYVQSVSATTPRKLADRAIAAAWSPDGGTIAYLSARLDSATGRPRYGIYTITEYGTDERLLAEGGMQGGGIAWSPDGASIAYVGADDDGPLGLFLLDVASGARTPVTRRESTHALDIGPAFSPDGRHLAFVRWVDDGSSHIYVVPVAGGAEQRLTDVAAAVAGLTWTPDGTVVFSSDRSGLYRLWEVAIGGTPRRLAVPAQDPGSPSISRDGTLLYTDWRYDTNIWVGTTAKGDIGEAAHPSTMWDEEPALSPDGTRLAFVSTRSGAPEIWTGPIGGTEATRLTDHGAGVHAPRWSPDGRWIAYQVRQDSTHDVFVVPVDGGTPHAVASHPANDVNPRWARDARSITFGSHRGGSWNVWRAPLDGGEPTQLTMTGAFVGEEDADGTTLYVMRPREAGLFAVDLAQDAEPQKVADIARSDWHNWASTTAGLFVLDRSEGAPRIVRYGPEGPRVITGDLPNMTPFRASMSVSEDGEAFAWGHLERAENDLAIVEGLAR